MLKYSEIKTTLYNSTEIQKIPDKWEESIPFFCKIKEENVVAFLYWSVSDHLTLRHMIGVNRESGKVIQLKHDELIELLSLGSDPIKPVKVRDYDKYFSDKERYEKIFSEYCDGNKIFPENKSEALNLLKSIVGIDLFEKVFMFIAPEYIKELS